MEHWWWFLQVDFTCLCIQGTTRLSNHLSRFWWGVSAKRSKGPFWSSGLGVICSLLCLLCLFQNVSSFSIIPLICLGLSVAFLLCRMGRLYLSSMYSMFLSVSAFAAWPVCVSPLRWLLIPILGSCQLFPVQHLSLDSLVCISISKTFCSDVCGQPVSILLLHLFHRYFSSPFSHFPPSLVHGLRPVVFSWMFFLLLYPFLCLPLSSLLSRTPISLTLALFVLQSIFISSFSHCLDCKGVGIAWETTVSLSFSCRGGVTFSRSDALRAGIHLCAGYQGFSW